jgi:hypothetical protein
MPAASASHAEATPVQRFLIRRQSDSAARLARLLEPRVPTALGKLPRRYVNRYLTRVEQISKRVDSQIKRHLDDLVDDVEREIVDVRDRLLAEWRAERKRL